jgi:LmbE family N-acetylglucosaminyl deacetylase
MAPRRDPDIGTILGVWGHPDDESYLCAGLMAAAVDAGRRVVCVTATRGEAGFPNDDPRPAEERAALRTTELAASMAVLGVEEHVFLDHPDGGCHLVDDDGPVQRIAEIIRDVRPDTVLTFDTDGNTGHDDHIAASRWTTLAVRAAGSDAELLYSTQTPEWNERFLAGAPIDEIMMKDMPIPSTAEEDLALWYRLDDAMVDRKVEALLAQASQTEALQQQLGAETYRELVRDEFFRAATAADWA